MNYRHHFHAGNYADVFKHVLLLQLLRAMQRKEKGFLYLDTHAGRGGYDLTVPGVLPDGRERAPEHPDGIGRLWVADPLPEAITEYVRLVRAFNVRRGAGSELRFYPGSPWIARAVARPQDRMVLCELRPDDAEALDFEFARESRVSVLAMDGYNALKAQLPPPEKRALVLIDPPFEAQGEFGEIERGVGEALRRLPAAVCAVWYPVTERAPTASFQETLRRLGVPALFAELHIAGDGSQLRMKGCGLLVLNPPWQIDGEIRAVLPELVRRLGLSAEAHAECDWLVPDR